MLGRASFRYRSSCSRSTCCLRYFRIAWFAGSSFSIYKPFYPTWATQMHRVSMHNYWYITAFITFLFLHYFTWLINAYLAIRFLFGRVSITVLMWWPASRKSLMRAASRKHPYSCRASTAVIDPPAFRCARIIVSWLIVMMLLHMISWGVLAALGVQFRCNHKVLVSCHIKKGRRSALLRCTTAPLKVRSGMNMFRALV